MIKILGDYTRKVVNEEGNLELTIVVKNYNDKKRIDELNKDTYSFEIKKPKSKRSLEQNSLLWALIREMAPVMQMDEMDIYIQLLESANAKYDYLLGLPIIENELKRNFRAVKVEGVEFINEQMMYKYKCFYGSSKFDTKEMTTLIDKALSYCAELDIQVPQNQY